MLEITTSYEIRTHLRGVLRNLAISDILSRLHDTTNSNNTKQRCQAHRTFDSPSSSCTRARAWRCRSRRDTTRERDDAR